MMLSRAVILSHCRGLVRAYTTISPKPYTVPEGAWGRNRAARLELAAAYRIMDNQGLNEGICNHLSVMAPQANGKGDGMLVFPYGIHWSEVTASNLVSVEFKDGKVCLLEGSCMPETTATCIHLGIRQVRPDAKVIMHTHQPYATSLACMKDPTLKMVHQNSLRFYNRVAYDNNYSGLATAIDEGIRLGKVLGDKDVMIMGHHGVLTVAPSVSLAYDLLYFLERAAQVQVLMEAMKGEVELIPDEECGPVCDQIWKYAEYYCFDHFYSLYRKLRKTQPDFEL